MLIVVTSRIGFEVKVEFLLPPPFSRPESAIKFNDGFCAAEDKNGDG